MMMMMMMMMMMNRLQIAHKQIEIPYDIDTCFIATSPMRPECFRMLSKKSLRSDIDASLMLSRSLGIVSHITCENRYLLTRGR